MKFAQLWDEEAEYLRKVADSLPAGSVVVELGTAQGGSARIFADGTKGRGCSLYTFDLAPSWEARENLAFTEAKLFAVSSIEGEASWPKVCGRPVDLLFIDADHTLASVFADYHAWVRWLRPGGRVLFHDYDRPERGGASHLGVRVFVDALIGADVLTDIEHVGRVLSARIDHPPTARIRVERCLAAWRAIGEHVQAVRKAGATWNSGPMDDLTRGYLVLAELKERREGLLWCAPNRAAFFKWEEFLRMLEHAAPPRPADPFAVESMSLDALSRLCAHEILRLAFAERLLGG